MERSSTETIVVIIQEATAAEFRGGDSRPAASIPAKTSLFSFTIPAFSFTACVSELIALLTPDSAAP